PTGLRPVPPPVPGRDKNASHRPQATCRRHVVASVRRSRRDAVRAWKYLGVAAVVVLGAGSASADPAASEKWFAGKSVEQRTLIQAELILANEYSGLADGK